MKKILVILMIFVVPGLLYADSIEIFSLAPNSAISFKDTGGSLIVDETELLKSSLNDLNAPSMNFGQEEWDYYNNGILSSDWDGISLNFDISLRDLSDIKSTSLRFFAQKGGYYKTSWEHYYILPGEFNKDYQNMILPNPISIDVNGAPIFTEGWIEANIPTNWISLNDLNNPTELTLTLRLWNLKVDAIELKLEASPPPSPVPEPSCILLIIFGFGGIAAMKGIISKR